MLIARKNEVEILKEAYRSEYSKFVAIYGRRRIGKTFLVRETFNNNFFFFHTGLCEEKKNVQIKAFCNSLKEYGYNETFDIPKDWLDTFELLKDFIKKSSIEKKVIFIDELSWIDTPNSGFFQAFEYFINSFVLGRKDILLIVSSSATSWILKKIIHNKGGLYNRVSYKIKLNPFTLSECKELLFANGKVFDNEQILKLYMALGGVPYYWDFVRIGYSADQNINNLFFEHDAMLKNEYDYIFKTLFKNYNEHLKIIDLLYEKKIGLTRSEIEDANIISSSGSLSIILDELEACGFIRKYYKYGNKKKDAVYQIIDNFVLFYHSFKNISNDNKYWLNNINTPKYNTWCGLSYELVCMQHIEQIKNALGISGISTNISSYRCCKDTDKGIIGSQIDLIIDRADRVINLCEIKYSKGIYTLKQDEIEKIKIRKNDFIIKENIKRPVWVILITTFDVSNAYSYGDITKVITLDNLFK